MVNLFIYLYQYVVCFFLFYYCTKIYNNAIGVFDLCILNNLHKSCIVFYIIFYTIFCLISFTLEFVYELNWNESGFYT